MPGRNLLRCVAAVTIVACSNAPTAPHDEFPLTPSLTFEVPALSASGAAAYEAILEIWGDGDPEDEFLRVTLEEGVTDRFQVESPRLAPERFDSLAVVLRGRECTLVDLPREYMVRALPAATNGTIVLEPPLVDSARLEIDRNWCGAGVDNTLIATGRFAVGIRFESTAPEALSGTFQTTYTVSRGGERGVFTGSRTGNSIELHLEVTHAVAACLGDEIVLTGTILPGDRIGPISMTSSSTTCPIPPTAVQLYTAPDDWQL